MGPRRGSAGWSAFLLFLLLGVVVPGRTPSSFVFQSSSSVATDFCCMDHLSVGGTLIYSKFHGTT